MVCKDSAQTIILENETLLGKVLSGVVQEHLHFWFKKGS